MILENYDTVIFNEVADLCNELPVELIRITNTDGVNDMKIRPYDEKATKELLYAYWYNHIYPQPVEIALVDIFLSDGCYEIVVHTRKTSNNEE